MLMSQRSKLMAYHSFNLFLIHPLNAKATLISDSASNLLWNPEPFLQRSVNISNWNLQQIRNFFDIASKKRMGMRYSVDRFIMWQIWFWYFIEFDAISFYFYNSSGIDTVTWLWMRFQWYDWQDRFTPPQTENERFFSAIKPS